MWSRVAHAAVRLPILAIVLAALWSFARLPDIPWTLSLPIALIAVLTAVRPLEGLLTVAAFVPLATVTAQRFGTSSFRSAEVVALAGIAGWLARMAFDRSWPVPARIRRPAMWFALIVAASAIVQLAVLQAQRDYPGPFLRSFFNWLRFAYVSDFGSFPAIHAAALLLEGVALFVAATAASLRAPARAAALRRMLVVGGAAAALLNVSRLAVSALGTETPLYSLWVTLHWVRLNVHFGDVNAAGSQFALVLLIACGLAVADKRLRLVWIVCAVILGAGQWLAGSRTAHAGFLAALACWIVISFVAPRWPRLVRPRVLLALTAALALLAIVGVGVVARSSGDVRRAIAIRADLTGIALHMTASDPLFGIGIGRFYPESGQFMTPLLRTYYTHENAHNNFLQILAELGIAGVCTFLWILGSVLVTAVRTYRERTIEQNVTLFAIAAFLLTALGGHPLLIHEVAFTFWLALAALAAELPVPAVPAARRTSGRAIAALSAAALAISIVVRAGSERASTDFEHVTYGFGGWQRGPEGERYRTAHGEATFFVMTNPQNVFRVELPLRVQNRPTGFRIDVDDQRALTFQLAPGTWRTVVLTIPPSPGTFKRVTVRADDEFMAGAVRARHLGPRWQWADADGDRRADFTVYRPGSHEWLSLLSSSGTQSTRYVLGSPGATPVPRDYDGDGIQDPAVHNPADATWSVLLSGNRSTKSITTQFGMAGDIPVPADYDRDDKADLALFRPSTGLWAVKQSSNGEVVTILWGTSSDMPVPADYDGDGAANIAVFRPATGEWWILDQARRAPTTYVWGRPGDIPVPADYDGDYQIDIAVFRPATRTWHVRTAKGVISTIEWGAAGDIPMPADYDGDGKADLAVFRPSTSQWLVFGKSERDWGQAGDVPVPRP